MSIDYNSYIERLSMSRAKAWRELGHAPTIHSRHLADFGRLADEVQRLEKEIALAYSAKRLQRAGRSKRRPDFVPY